MAENKTPQTYAEKYASYSSTREREVARQRAAQRRKRNSQKKKRHSQEFSKWLLVQETGLIWITTLTFLALAFICIKNQYFGELPWLTAMAAFPWTAYGVSQAFYYKKASAENTKGGIKYETTMAELTPDDIAMMNSTSSTNDPNAVG